MHRIRLCLVPGRSSSPPRLPGGQRGIDRSRYTCSGLLLWTCPASLQIVGSSLCSIAHRTGRCSPWYAELIEHPDQHVLQVCGQPASVHIANGVDVDQAAEAASLPEAPGTPSEGEDASISKLLGALRSHSDKHAAVQAAFKAVMQTPQLQVGAASSSFSVCCKPWRCFICRSYLHHAPAYDLQGSRSICALLHVLSRLQITILHVSICGPCKAHTLADPKSGIAEVRVWQ